MSIFMLLNYTVYRPIKLLTFMLILLVFFVEYSRVSRKKLLIFSLITFLSICSIEFITIYLIPGWYSMVPLSAIVYVSMCVVTGSIILRKLVAIPGSVLFYAFSLTVEFAIFISSNIFYKFLHFSSVENLILLSAITLIVGISLCIIIHKYIVPLFRMCTDSKIWIDLSITPILGSIGFFVIYDMQSGSNHTIITCIGSIILYVALMFSNAIGAISIRHSVLAAEYAAKLKSTDELLTIQKERYSEIAVTVAETRQARHDLHHQMNVMSALLKTGKYDELNKYFDKYESEIPEISISTGNSVADVIISKYLTQAHKENTDITYQLQLPAECCIDDTDLCVIMGNCLENALEACLKLPESERKISVVSIVQGSYLGLTFENSFNGILFQKDGELLSVKRGGGKSGFGLASVSRVVEKYNGSIKISHTDNLFSVALVLEYR